METMVYLAFTRIYYIHPVLFRLRLIFRTREIVLFHLCSVLFLFLWIFEFILTLYFYFCKYLIYISKYIYFECARYFLEPMGLMGKEGMMDARESTQVPLISSFQLWVITLLTHMLSYTQEIMSRYELSSIIKTIGGGGKNKGGHKISLNQSWTHLDIFNFIPT